MNKCDGEYEREHVLVTLWLIFLAILESSWALKTPMTSESTDPVSARTLMQLYMHIYKEKEERKYIARDDVDI